jgi:hypothetical protein
MYFIKKKMPRSKRVPLTGFYIQGFDPQQQRPSSFQRGVSKKILSNNRKNSYILNYQDSVLRGGEMVPQGWYITSSRQTKDPNSYYWWLVVLIILVLTILIVVFFYQR